MKGISNRARAADAKARAQIAKTNDSYTNFAAKLGIGTQNLSSAGTYGFNPITRNRLLLEWIHRGSWLGGVAVDLVADDMTKRGVSLLGGIKPKDIEHLDRAATTLDIWGKLNDTVKWSRLYGGSIAVMMIDGQNVASPLNVDRIQKNQFKGMQVLDRWMIEPSLNDLVTELGPELGMPKFYTVNSDAPALRSAKIHYTRIVRLEGIRLPFNQRMTENYWGISVIERLYDRMVAFDSATQGAAQMVFKAYIRTYKLKDLRQIVATGGDALVGLLKQIEMMRLFQSSEGITLLDGEDEFEGSAAGSASFGGLADALVQFGQQLAGALQIPLVRLFGQSPAGLNSTGESDLRTYYDGINQQQNRHLKNPVTTIYRVLAISEGVNLPEGFAIEFRPLWILSDMDKVQIANGIATAVSTVDQGGIISRPTSLKELKQSSNTTGIFTNISDEELKAAEMDPLPGAEEALMLESGTQELEHGEREQDRADKEAAKPTPKKAKGKDRRRTRDMTNLIIMGDVKVMGFDVVVEHLRGDIRYGNRLPAAYGYIRKTDSAERGSQMDCFVGPVLDGKIFVIDSYKENGKFDESKIMFGYSDRESALEDFRRYYF